MLRGFLLLLLLNLLALGYAGSVNQNSAETLVFYVAQNGNDEDDKDKDKDDKGNSGSENSGSNNDDDDDSDSGNNSNGSDNANDNSGSGNNNAGGNGNSGNNNAGGNGNSDSDNANDNSGPDNNNAGGNGNSGSSGNGSDNSVNASKVDERRYYVGEVSANDGTTILMGGTQLRANSPWLPVLAPGMWFEAFGEWDNDVFIAEDINVLIPDHFAYYRGPAAALGESYSQYDNVEAWTQNDAGIIDSLHAVPQTDNNLQLVAYFDGIKLIAAPENLPAAPPGLSEGWVELTGNFLDGVVVWQSFRSFP